MKTFALPLFRSIWLVKGYTSPERDANGQSLLPLPIGMINKKVKVVNWGNTGVAAIGKQ